MKDKIEFSEFLEIEKKLEIKLGTISEVEKISGSNKMLKLTVNLGEEENRTVVTNIGKGLSESEAKIKYGGQAYYFVTNLKPANIMGIESTAMILIPTLEDEIVNTRTIGSKLL